MIKEHDKQLGVRYGFSMGFPLTMEDWTDRSGHPVRAHAWINRDQMGMSQIYGYYI